MTNAPDPAKRALLDWYRENKRALPWRADRDAYRIWISETMLQQTTTTAVIPFYARFLDRFPTLENLAGADVERVVEAWAGLGYYSRARNLHASARALVARGGFPRTWEELIEMPGFGPYTARSVASLAFDQPVGVVDGNVIRVLARYYARDWEWWQLRARVEIQALADRWVRDLPSHEMNQALMELGRTICTPKLTACLLCPLSPGCAARREGRQLALPKPRPRREREIWAWHPSVAIEDGRILLAINDHVPFLKGQWLLPGRAERLDARPTAFDYRHSVTHHDIYVTVSRALPNLDRAVTKWVHLGEIARHVPASLVRKALARVGGAVAGGVPRVGPGA